VKKIVKEKRTIHHPGKLLKIFRVIFSKKREQELKSLALQNHSSLLRREPSPACVPTISSHTSEDTLAEKPEMTPVSTSNLVINEEKPILKAPAPMLYDSIIVQHIVDAKKILAEKEGWVQSYDKDGTTAWRKPLTGSPIDTFKIVATLNASPQVACNRIWNFKFSDWKYMDENVLGYDILENISENAKIIWQGNSLPWPLYSRDVVMITIKVEENGSFMILNTSRGLDSSKWPHDKKKFVRSVLHFNTFLFEPITRNKNKCKLTQVINIDPAGNIPPSIVNSQAGKIYLQPKWLNDKIFNKT